MKDNIVSVLLWGREICKHEWRGGYRQKFGKLGSVVSFTDMPVITGQDNTAMAQKNIKDGKQAMTIDKNLKDMAYNTAMIINSLIANSPVQASQTVSNIPVFYSNLALMTIDSY